MEIKEKLMLLTGKDAWATCEFDGIPSIKVSDGPHALRYVYKEENGVQFSYPNITYPTFSILSCSWDLDLVKEVGSALAEDCIANKVDVLLGPGVNVKRTPLCGRNFEYFSEDPYLAGMLAKNYIEGVQSKGIGTSLKHFVANNREYDRFFQSSEIDERTLQEIYYLPFKIAIQAKPWTVMCSYNPLNGVYTSENKKLLKDVLRDQFGFDGLIVSDWGACKNRVKSLNASLDLAMPYDERFYTQLNEAYINNTLNMDYVDESVGRILNVIDKIKETESLRTITKTQDEKYALAVKAIEKSAVLLKNNNVLPLRNESIEIIGKMAVKPPLGGGGSSLVNPIVPIKSLDKELKELLPNNDIHLTEAYFMDYGYVTAFGYRPAMMNAHSKDVAIVCVGNDEYIEKESLDRENISLKNEMIDLIKNVSKAAKKTIVILFAGSAINVNEFDEYADAIIYAGFGGNGVLKGLANLITGKANFSGKLSETFVNSLEDVYNYNQRGNGFEEVYGDRMFVGYRYYDSNNIDVKYPFGYGLSYSKFEYSDLKVENIDKCKVKVTYKIKNVSSVEGEEISQIYVHDVFSMVARPLKELKAFNKVHLNPNEEKTIEIVLDEFAFSYYSTVKNDFYVENGEFIIMVGASSREIKLTQSINIALDDDQQFSIY